MSSPLASATGPRHKTNLYLATNVPDPGGHNGLSRRNYEAPNSWAEKAYPKLIYFHETDKGGHFAAWEQPALFSANLRAAFKSLRQRLQHRSIPVFEPGVSPVPPDMFSADRQMFATLCIVRFTPARNWLGRAGTWWLSAVVILIFG
jgi:hypothetical protein